MADDIIGDSSPQLPAQPATRFTEFFQQTSWGAIWAGVLVALGMEIMFTLFGFFIGFDIYNANGANGSETVWSMAWYLVTQGCSMFVGAWCAAALAGYESRPAAILHGMTTWGLAEFATFLITGLGLWAVVSAATAITNGTPATAGNVGARLNTMEFFGTLWGGIFLGLITAYFGGIAGRLRATAVGEAQEAPGAGRPRRAA